MLLNRSLPPPFLLPAWSPQQLTRLVQRAHKSDDALPQRHRPRTSRTLPIRFTTSPVRIRPVLTTDPTVRPPPPWKPFTLEKNKQKSLRAAKGEERRTRIQSEPGIKEAESGLETLGQRKARGFELAVSEVADITTSRYIDKLSSAREAGEQPRQLYKTEIQGVGKKAFEQPQGNPKDEAVIARPGHPDRIQLGKGDKIVAESLEQPQKAKFQRKETITELLEQRHESTPEIVDDETIAKTIRKLLHLPEPNRSKPDGAEPEETNSTEPRTSKMPKIQKRKVVSDTHDPKKPISLFDDLFPEESRARQEQQKEAEDMLEKLPAFHYDVKPQAVGIEEAKRLREEELGRIVPFIDQQQIRDLTAVTQSVLVLKACSKTLEESDFFRLGPKGAHIEGWIGQILKGRLITHLSFPTSKTYFELVIPVRDNNTLEPIGEYYILFASRHAAQIYYDLTRRLHSIYKQGDSSTLPLPASSLQEREEARSQLSTFSLVPGYSKLNLKILRSPYHPQVVKLIANGGVAQIAARKSKSGDMVLFTIDYGHITQYDLSKAIADDGRRRNLHWRLAGGLRGDDNIVRLNYNPFDSQSGEVRDELEQMKVAREARLRPSRFVISFKDRHEARRFVREWHRRPFPQYSRPRPEDETAPLVSAKILW